MRMAGTDSNDLVDPTIITGDKTTLEQTHDDKMSNTSNDTEHSLALTDVACYPTHESPLKSAVVVSERFKMEASGKE